MTTDQLFDAVVLGAGPAGATAAVGLARLGYSVALVSCPRSPSVEGLSARAVASLEEAGFPVDCVSAPASRLVRWAGETSRRGRESVVRREALDDCLGESVRAHGVRRIDSSVRGFQYWNEIWHVQTSSGPFRGRSVLDARGRRARRSDIRGPLLVAWSATFSSNEVALPGSAVAALEDGWCWFARTGDGTSSLQFVGAATGHLSPSQVIARYEAAAATLAGFEHVGIPATIGDGLVARAAVARFSRPSRGPGFLRIGDAAVAMDPLSGNGIHEAVRSARVGVAAVNSYLGGTEWSAVSQFVDERALELWRRTVSAAAQFYRSQAAHSVGSFWERTASAYERLASEAAAGYAGPGRFEMRPVLNGQQIQVRRVWVSAEWPRGIWQVNGRSLEEAPAELVPSILRRAAGVSCYEV